MSRETRLSSVLGAALLGTNLYWWWRERTTRRALQRSVEVSGDGAASAPVDSEAARAAREAATLLDTAPGDLPDRVDALDEKVRSLQRELDETRAAWARTVLDGHSGADGAEGAAVLTVTIPGGSLADATALATEAVERSGVVAIALVPGDGSFAVATGADVAGTDADAVAADLADRAGGDAGGDERVATGGAPPADLEAACREVRVELERRFSTTGA